MRAGAIGWIGTLLVACSAQAAARQTPSDIEPTPQPSVVSTGCGTTAVLHGGIAEWLDEAGGYNNPSDLNYVIAHPPLAAGFLFSYPLRAGHPENPGNKVLWVVRTPRNGPLTIDGHPLGATSPAVHDERPGNSGPGLIYPDGTDVPTAGCWQFDLRWANGHVQVELNYQ
jgi:hypothetical protein